MISFISSKDIVILHTHFIGALKVSVGLVASRNNLIALWQFASLAVRAANF